jgi:hypothetical protein
MRIVISCLIFLFSFQALSASSYYFIDPDHPVHLDLDAKVVGSAKFKTDPFDDSHVKYADSKNMLYYSYALNCHNYLSVGVGYSYLKFDWDKNPRFRQDEYHYGIGSISWISEALEDWRWVLSGGVTVDAKEFNFRHTGVGYAFGWGRYCACESLGLHVGALGWAGMRNGYALPIAGIDWQMTQCFRLHAIFPFDFTLRFYFDPQWYLAASYIPFGDYRYPRRAQDGIGRFDDAIFEVYSRGAELSLNFFKGKCFEAGLAGGWNLGGWIYIKDKHNHSAKYFQFKGAPYGHAYLSFNF